jgi:23S rRNA pseudouridine1911/1915/1917 synthase
MAAELTILFEDDGLIVVNKPPDLVCHPCKAGPESSLIGRLRLHLGAAAHPQLVNRLDRETSGLVVAAKTAAAARALRKAWEQREVLKEYWAIVHGHVARDTGAIEAPLGRAVGSPVAIQDAVRPDGVPARTRYGVVRRFQRSEGAFTWLRVWPETGRKHQIRIHLAHLGHALVGDKLYGGDERLYLDFVERRLTAEQRARLLLPCHALHAGGLKFRWRQEEREFRAEPEAWFSDFAAGRPLATDWAERYC